MKQRKVIKFIFSLAPPIALIIILTMPIGPLSGGLGILQPIGGIFDVGLGVQEPESQIITIEGLSDEVNVIIDEFGIPHIYATTAEDAHLVLGYLHARERLFQMVMQNYLAAGRISEIVGGYANSSDKYYRAIGLRRSAELTLEWYQNNTDNEDVAYALRMVQAEVDGVNAFINSMTSATTPIELKILGFTPETWKTLDVFIWAKMMTWGLSGGVRDFQRWYIRSSLDNDTMYNQLFNDLMPYTVPIIPEQTNLSLSQYPNAPGNNQGTPEQIVLADDKLEIIDISEEKLEEFLTFLENVIHPFGEGDLVGSNNWAVDGTKSATGSPILANDPHLGFQAPALWYEAHVVVPGILDVTGVSFPGLPGFVLGHTAHMAWGFTNVGADVVDIIVEKLNPEDSEQYEYNGEWKDFEIIEEIIKTREGADIPFQVKWSVHGPCIDAVYNDYDFDDENEENLAMMWTGNGVTHEVMSLAKLNKANNLEEYHDALFWWDSPPQNIIYADDAGHIALTVAGRFPIRSGYTGEYPVQLLNDSVGWIGNIPFAHVPRSVDPAQHYLQSCNQRPIDPAIYGYSLLGPFADGYRGRRIDFLLSNDDSVTVDDMKKFQADALEVRAEEIIPFVLDALDDYGTDSSLALEAISWLEDWDYVMNIDEQAPTFWLYLRENIHRLAFDEVSEVSTRIPLSRTPILEQFVKYNDTYFCDIQGTTDNVETWDDILTYSFEETVTELEETFGSNTSDWIYGNHHRVYLDHLALRGVYIGGGPHRGQNTLLAAGGWRVTHGPSWRLVADLGNINNSYGVYPGGQSGCMFSPHWDDLFELWYAFDEETQQYGYHPLYFYSTFDAFIDADTEGTMIERRIQFLG